MNLAGVHGPTMDGAVRHKDQVVAGALAAHPDGRDLALVGVRSHDVSAPPRTGCPASVPAGARPRTASWRAGAAAVVATPAEVLTVLGRIT
jgi:phosphoglycolate phosphatase